jgi:hypothetical protein
MNLKLPALTTLSEASIIRALNLAGALLVVTTFLIVYFNGSRGFDVTDEAYYLLNAQTNEFPAHITSFGKITGLLLLLADGDIGAFRVLGLILIGSLAALLGWSVENYQMSKSVPKKKLFELSAAICAFFGSLVLYQRWILTPSYNWLALIATLLVGIGLVNSAYLASQVKKVQAYFYLTAVLVGIGGGLSFIAKPTTAALVALTSLAWICFSDYQRKKLGFLLVAVFSAMVFMGIYVILCENGLYAYFEKLRVGVELISLLEAGHSYSAIASSILSEFLNLPSAVWKLVPWSILFAVLASTCLYTLNFFKMQTHLVNRCSVVFLAILLLCTFSELTGGDHWSGFVPGQTALAILTPAVLAVTILGLRDLDLKKPNNMFALTTAKIAALMLALALAFASGSGNGLLRQTMLGFVFYAIILHVLARICSRRLGQVYTESAVLVIVTAISLTIGWNGYVHPYRLPASISAQTSPLFPIGARHYILLDETSLAYATGLQELAIKAGWKRGMSLINLTGNSPGAAVFLAAKVPGTAWLLGGYNGSAHYAQSALSLVSNHDLEQAWVLNSPLGKRKIPEKVLNEIGLEFPSAYTVVGVVANGYSNDVQVLWRPLKQTPR